MKPSLLRLSIFAALLFSLPRPACAADPCKLLTAEEVAPVIGSSVSPNPFGNNGCMWGSGLQRVILMLGDASAWSQIIAPAPHITKTEVSGIGDAAFFGGGFGTWTLTAKQGNEVISIVVIGAKTPDLQKSSEQSLAKLALKRL
jgi:hypothetical protein